MDHLRSFHVGVPHTSASRIKNTVWWFLPDVAADSTLVQASGNLAYPPTKARPDPRDNGTDLVGRHFIEPELGVCIIIGPGPVIIKKLATRAQIQQQRNSNEPAIGSGSHFTLRYRHIGTCEEHYSSVSEILYWIALGPVLTPPTLRAPLNQTDALITTFEHVPATARYVPNETAIPGVETMRNLDTPLVPCVTEQRVPLQEQRVALDKRQSEIGGLHVINSPHTTWPPTKQQVLTGKSVAMEGTKGIDRSHLARNKHQRQRKATAFLASFFLNLRQHSSL
jgi:hypothetical protein